MKPAAARVLELLYDRGDAFVAVEELGRTCGLRAGGLAEAMEELRAGGQRLEVSPAHGVRLVRPLRLDAHLIERDLGVARVGRNVICFAQVDSTNDVAFEAAPQEQSDGLVVLAEHQRRGRGRQGHAWQSPPGANILMSAVLLDNGLVLVAGGTNGPPFGFADGLSAVEIYNPTTNTWTTGPSLPVATNWPVVVTLQCGYVLFAGGDDNGGLAATQLYVPAPF